MASKPEERGPTDSVVRSVPEPAVDTAQPLRLIIHIGMGKTGTSSIQRALMQGAEAISAQGVCYLGMWMDLIDSSYHGLDGLEKFVGLNPAEHVEAADVFTEKISERSQHHGLRTFILSNEGLSPYSLLLAPFLQRVQENGIDIRILCYVRDPVTWLPAAYNQWAIRHKSVDGALQEYATFARDVVGWYRGPLEWREAFPESMIVRSYESCTNVVADFADSLSLDLPTRDQRDNRSDTADDLLLRTFFASQVEKCYLPEDYEHAIGVVPSKAPRLVNIWSTAFDLSQTSEIIAENAEMFDSYREKFGFDPRQSSADPISHMPDLEVMRDRLVEITTGVALNQSLRINSLESEVAGLRKDLQHLIDAQAVKPTPSLADRLRALAGKRSRSERQD